jgi:hypothetical protein
MYHQRIGAHLYHGRKLDPRDVLAICVYVVPVAVIGVLLLPLAVLCALFVIVVQTTPRFCPTPMVFSMADRRRVVRRDHRIGRRKPHVPARWARNRKRSLMIATW